MKNDVSENFTTKTPKLIMTYHNFAWVLISYEKFGNFVERFSRTSLFLLFDFLKISDMFEKRKEITFTKKVATTDNIEKQWKKVQRFQKERKKGKPTQKKKKSNKKEQKQKPSTKQIRNFFRRQ